MKSRQNAKQKREADERKRKERWLPAKAAPEPAACPPAPPKPPAIPPAELFTQSQEEDALVFLAYLEQHQGPMRKDDTPQPVKRKAKAGSRIGVLNLEEGMPVVEEAVSRMRVGLQEMKAGRIMIVKLIHGYGSTGRGGKICTGVRQELAGMKRRKLIRDFIPGEDFGPMDDASRRLAEQEKLVPRDPDYGRMNHGITVVVL